MKTFHKYYLVISVLLLAILAVSCNPATETMGSDGQTLVKLYPDGYTMVPFDAAATPQSGTLFEVRKDVNNSTNLNTATTVVLQYDVTGSILAKYNAVNGTEFIPLPSSLGTTDPSPVGGVITLNFAAGDFSKTITVSIPNASIFDFSKQYAYAYKLVSVSGAGVKSVATNDTIVAQVLIKNKYDGTYVVTANSPMVDILNSGLTGWYPFTYELHTSGANSVKCLLVDPGYYDYYHPITSAGTYSVYGAFGLELTFDPTTGAITSVTNPWGNPPSNTRMPVIDPSGVNKYDGKTIHFKYWMKQPSLVPAAPNIRTSFDETWTRK